MKQNIRWIDLKNQERIPWGITIIWWTDGFWKWLAIFSIENFSNEIELTITWRNKEKWNKLAKELGCNFEIDNIKAVRNADITIFSTPIWVIEKTIKEIAPHLKSWSLVSDVCSIKKFTSNSLQKYSPESVLIIPTHPMFWPSTWIIAGQIVVLTPLNENDKQDTRYIFLKTFLKKSWAKVIDSNPIEHDKMMAVVQWLTHFDMFVLWETIKRLWIDVEKSLNFVSPIYKIMLSSVWRYVYQHPKLHWDIQMYNDEVLNVHKVFMETTNDFNKFVIEKDKDKFINTILWTHEYFWKTAKKWHTYTDKIIHLLSKQIEIIEKNIWKEIIITNIYSKEKISWIALKYENEILYFNNWKYYNIDEWEINTN